MIRAPTLYRKSQSDDDLYWMMNCTPEITRRPLVRPPTVIHIDLWSRPFLLVKRFLQFEFQPLEPNSRIFARTPPAKRTNTFLLTLLLLLPMVLAPKDPFVLRLSPCPKGFRLVLEWLGELRQDCLNVRKKQSQMGRLFFLYRRRLSLLIWFSRVSTE